MWQKDSFLGCKMTTCILSLYISIFKWSPNGLRTCKTQCLVPQMWNKKETTGRPFSDVIWFYDFNTIPNIDIGQLLSITVGHILLLKFGVKVLTVTRYRYEIFLHSYIFLWANLCKFWQKIGYFVYYIKITCSFLIFVSI